MKYVVGVDIGTGSAKAVALNLDAETLAVAQHYYPTYSPQSGYSEQDPEIIWESFKACLDEITEQLHTSPEAISLSSAMHSLIPVDSFGRKLMDMITWADCRSDEVAGRLNDSLEGRYIYEVSGMPVHAMSPLCKIIWLRENRSDIFKQAHKFISVKEYIWYKLFGEYTVDYSIAGASGMLDITTLTWSQPLLMLAGIRENQLSELVNTTYTTCGIIPSRRGLSNTTVFVIGASDGCLANLGSYAIKDGVAAITVGTSGAVRIASTKPLFNSPDMTFSYYLDEGIFICGGPVNNGGNVLQWLVKDFLGKAVNTQGFEEAFALMETVKPGADGLLFLPYLHGERAPIWDAKSSGAFIGIRGIHRQAHFCRAVLEGICYALNHVLQAVEKNSGPIYQVNVSGGFVHSAIWTQTLADITGKKVSLFQTEDASAIGAAFLGMKACGLNDVSNLHELNQGRQLSIEPDAARHAVYKRSFLVFKSLYSGLKDSMHKINFINS